MPDSSDNDEFDRAAPILAEYLTRVDRGEAVSRDAFLVEHAEHADVLRRYFADVDFLAANSTELAPLMPAARLASPRNFGDYELLDEIGRGGMGIVYRARERSTGRIVALKMLLHGLFVSSAEAARFRNEARTAAGLTHPGIVPIYHAGENQGRLFYTMPLIEGTNLAQRINDKPLDSNHAAGLLLEIAEAVDNAHSRSVVHRDLKPANILIDERGRAFVSDFGLARRFGEESLGLTATGDLLGTPNYMAPEQVNGRHDDVGPTTDVYALGAILYAMLVGRPPFRSDSLSETLQRICTVDPPGPRQLNRSVPSKLETICLKCLEKSPASRYQAVRDLADDLRRFLAGEPLRAQRVSHVERCRRWFVRNPIIGSLAGALAIALVAGTAFSLHYARRADQRAQQAISNLYAADMHLAQQHVQSGAVASAIALLEKHRPPGAFMDAPWEWRHLWRQCHGELRRFEGPRGAVYAAGFSPDGRFVAAAGEDGTVWIWSTGTGDVLHKWTGHAATINDLTFLHGGRRMATVGDDGATIFWEVETGARLAERRRHERPPTTVDASSDGALIATAGREDAAINLWNGTTFELQQSLAAGPANDIAFSPDGARLALGGRDGNVRIWRRHETEGWVFDATFRGHGDEVRAVAWASDGARLATGGADRFVRIWDASTWQESAAMGPLKNSVHSLAFSPDDRRLAIAERNQPVRVWDAATREPIVALRGHTSLVTRVEFCPAGWRLLSASEDGTVRLWDAARETDCDQLAGHLGKVRTIAFSPDGELLASGGQDGAVSLWDVEVGLPLRVLRPAAANDVMFSPDGKLLSAAGIGGHFSIWSIDSSEPSLDIRLSDQHLESVDWAPDGRRVAVHAIDGSVRIVEPTTGQVAATWQAPQGIRGCVAYSHDGRSLLTAGSDASVRIWDPSNGSAISALNGHTASTVGATFSPNDQLIASSSEDQSLRIWRSDGGRLVRTLTGHIGTTFGPAFSPDSQRLASSSTDHSVKIWDVDNGLELLSLDDNLDWVRDVAFSADGQCLASAGYDGLVRVWHAGAQDTEWSTKREAAALIRHLADQVPRRDQLQSAIDRDSTIGEAVRQLATRQASDGLLACTSGLAGHRAAERQDWQAAIAAFERASQLAPHDVMHWHWLAMASLAGGDPATYRRACEATIDPKRVRNDKDEEFLWTTKTWLVAPHTPEEMAHFESLFQELAQQFPQHQNTMRLYQIRRDATTSLGNEPRSDFGVAPTDWYVFALACYRNGRVEQSLRAYEVGRASSRSMFPTWDGKAYDDALGRELAGLLGVAQAAR